MNIFRIYFYILLVGVFFTACSDSPRPKNTIKPQAIPETFAMRFERLDVPLFKRGKSLDSLKAWHQSMLADGPAFYKLYLDQILRVVPDSATTFSLYRFAGSRDWRDLQKDIEQMYPTTIQLENRFTRAFGQIKTAFPEKATPDVFFYNSGFNVGIWPDSNLLGIGLEWYLGKENKIVKMLPPDFPQWQRDNMDSSLLVSDAVKGWFLVNFYQREFAKNLLEYMVFNGKVVYATEAVLAPIADSTLFGYTGTQMAWSYEQENNIWKELIKNDLLYSTKEKDVTRLTSDGPFTPGFPQNSAPMTGVFIGWKMVADYMRKHPETTLNELMYKVSAKEILKTYKPKK